MSDTIDFFNINFSVFKIDFDVFVEENRVMVTSGLDLTSDDGCLEFEGMVYIP